MNKGQAMNTDLFIYGKNEGLGNVLKSGGLRFTDIHHYCELENKKVRDDERIKSMMVKKENISCIRVGEIQIPSSDLAGPIKLGLPPKRCFCLCMSRIGYNGALYSRFDANICLKVDLEMVLTALNDSINHNGDLVIQHKPICYTDDLIPTHSHKPEDLVFIKPRAFEIEQEYRLAIFFPYDDKTVWKKGADTINLFGNKEPYIELGYYGNGQSRIFVKEARSIDGTVVYRR